MSDLIIVGGGVIGLAIAYELAGKGVAVRLVERGEPGREASWAGAGILTPASTAGARAPIDRLRALSLELTPPWVEAIHEATGLDPGYRRYGALYLAAGDAELEELERAAADWAAQGVEAEPLTAAAARRLEPALGPGVDRAYRLPGEAQIRNPRLLAALAEACRRRGVTLDTGCEVTGLRVEGRRVTALDTAAGPIPGDRFVLAAGAWTPALAAGAGIELAGEPVRGQIVLLDAPAPPFRHNLWSGERYAVARDDGRVLVGSTMERAGFDKRPTAEGVAGLLELARRLVPALAAAPFVRAWAGLRPGSLDGHPVIGRAPGHHNLYLATGHHRAGLELAAGTARVLTDLLLDRPPPVPQQPMPPHRPPREPPP
jgi:glycine oxidase